MPKSFIQSTLSHKRNLLYGTAVGVLIAIAHGDKVYAACAPLPFTAGNDTVTCTSSAQGFDALSGDDIVVMTGNYGTSSGSNDAFGNDGNDTMTLANGSLVDDFLGGDDNDILIVGALGTVGDDVQGGSGNDTITIEAGGGVGDDVQGNQGADFITVAGNVGGSLAGGSESDTLVLSGDVDGNVEGNEGADFITINNGSVGTNVLGQDGNDQITMVGDAANANNVFGGTGDDVIAIGTGVDIDNIFGEGGSDTITYAGSTADDIQAGAGDDTVTMLDGHLAGGIDASSGNDVVSMFGGSIEEDIDGGSGSDQITVGGDAEVENDVDGDSGNDHIVVAGTASIGEDIEGGEGNDSISLGDTAFVDGSVVGNDGDDIIVMTGGQIGSGDDGANNDIQGNTGNDQITITGGTVDDAVEGNDGDDTISITGGLIGIGNVDGDVFGGTGQDLIVMTGGSVGPGALDGDLFGGDDNDLISVGGGFVNDDVQGNDGDDILSVTGGSVGDDVNGNDGNDSIVIGGGTVRDDVTGNSGNDQITMTAGQVDDEVRGGSGNDNITVAGGLVQNDVEGNDGNDLISVEGGVILGDVEGDSGTDQIFLSAGSVGDVFGGTANDLFLLSGTASIADGIIAGELGDDFINLTDAAGMTGTEIRGDSGNDQVQLGQSLGDVLVNAVGLFGGSGSADLALFSGFDGQLSSGFDGFELVYLVNGANLDVHHPNHDDRDLSAGASGGDQVLFVDPTSTLSAGGNSPGTFTWTGDHANLGVVTMLDDEANDNYTITGNYAGGEAGTSSLVVDAALDITELGDLFTFGAVAPVNVPPPGPGLINHGVSAVIVNDVGNGIGQLTGNGPGDGIPVIDVSASGLTDDDDFFLPGGPIQAGAVEYDLALESDNIWYLQSDFLDQVFGYAGAPSAILGMARDYMGNLHERVGSLEQTWTGGATQVSDGSGVWLRSGGFFGKVDSGKDDQRFDYSQNHWFAQLGADLALMSDASTGQLIGSIMGHAGYSNTQHDANGNELITQNYIHSYGGGLALTWYGGPAGGWAGEGLYVDGIAQFTFYDLETKTEAEGKRGETDGWGWSIGLELGYGINLGGERDGPRLVPQLQIVYSQVNLDDFTDEEGVDVDFGKANSLEGRLGVAIDSGKMWRSVNAYAEANIIHEFLGETDVTVTTLPVDYDLGGTSAELGLGGTVSMLDNVFLYADVDYRIPFDDGRSGAQVIGGLRVAF